jgi:hypothetical protein
MVKGVKQDSSCSRDSIHIEALHHMQKHMGLERCMIGRLGVFVVQAMAKMQQQFALWPFVDWLCSWRSRYPSV